MTGARLMPPNSPPECGKPNSKLGPARMHDEEEQMTMTDPRRIAAAAQRARRLLAESHEPLTMTPGDVRALLARTQRCLQELADAAEPVPPDAAT